MSLRECDRDGGMERDWRESHTVVRVIHAHTSPGITRILFTRSGNASAKVKELIPPLEIPMYEIVSCVWLHPSK